MLIEDHPLFDAYCNRQNRKPVAVRDRTFILRLSSVGSQTSRPSCVVFQKGRPMITAPTQRFATLSTSSRSQPAPAASPTSPVGPRKICGS